jgi:pyrroloquinoline quinone biosynthesis protein E
MVVHRRTRRRAGHDRHGEALGAALEIAQCQYYAWRLAKRARAAAEPPQLDRRTANRRSGAHKTEGACSPYDYVVPDYHCARAAEILHERWARQFLNITPSARRALPCRRNLPGIDFPSVRESSLADIWYRSDAFNRFRGTDWMPEPCRSCDGARSTGAAAAARPWP